MRKLSKKLSIVLLLTILSIISYALFTQNDPISIVRGNYSYKPIPFRLENTNDIVCKMIIHTYQGSCQAITKEGDSYFFNDIGCMMSWIEGQKNQKNIKLWVYTKDTNRWIDAHLALYSTIDKTVVGYGFGASEEQYKNNISFDEMKLRMLQGRHLLNSKFRKRLLNERYRF